ncbi:hypothetical protein LEL_10812 [Akanthomyces lecanii RCEF 1005]|uniref:Uncharacterized protein n=1 Tax=Akanthomyces lecanii RCEF 1005 TaxID=1081108 RepID=A0A167T2X7_CORDF|nr:hypothetical protein LEL_10812 [Akanthomyces lecanii RCEF 1005]
MPQAPAQLYKGVYRIRCAVSTTTTPMAWMPKSERRRRKLADTRSNTYSVKFPYDIYCEEGMCKDTGNKKTSNTSKFVDNSFNDVVSNQGYGSVLSDNLSSGSNSFEAMKFGYILGHYRNTLLPLAALAALSLVCTDKYSTTRSFTQALYEMRCLKSTASSSARATAAPWRTGE